MKQAALGLVLALVLVSCGPVRSRSSSEPPQDPNTPVTSTSAPDAPVPSVGPSRVEPRSGQLDVRAIGWDHFVKEGPKRLAIVYWSGVEPCNVLDHVELEERKSEVTVTLFEGHAASDEDTACIEIALEKSVLVELAAPLQGRDVKDGADPNP